MLGVFHSPLPCLSLGFGESWLYILGLFPSKMLIWAFFFYVKELFPHHYLPNTNLWLNQLCALRAGLSIRQEVEWVEAVFG